MRNSRAAILLLVMATFVMAAPLTAHAVLTNEYGMTFSGQNSPITGCLACHDNYYGETLHGRHVSTSLTVAPPSEWSNFQGSGSVQTIGSAKPGSGGSWFTRGGSYSIRGLTWMTMFDYEGGSRWSEEEPPLMFFSGSPTTSTANPWNRVSGLVLGQESPYYEYLPNTSGGVVRALTDAPVSSTCGIVNCHFTGGTQPLASNQASLTIPNPAVTRQPTTQTKTQWARSTDYSAEDFNTTAAASYMGLGVQCEKCHGTGLKSSDLTTRHFNSGTQLSHRLAAQTVNGQQVQRTTLATLGRSDVCGVCHGLRSATPTAGALPYSMGYTPNLFVRDFVSVNATRGTSAPYTYTPTAAEFAANAGAYSLYPNGNPKNGGHGGNQYWAWAASAHAVRVQTGVNDPDRLPGARNSRFNVNGATTTTACLRCHSGEGYLTTKASQPTQESPSVDSVWKDFTISKTTAGFMGQECVICHNPHPASTRTEDVIRAADPAGVRSNLGRTTANASMCEDCHNWQLETLADQAPVAGFNPQSPPARVSHPQREVLHGIRRGSAPVMWEVPDMGEFMPGAQCQDCHMPKTDTGAEYTSHRMMIQMPGEALEWGATGQDSCTICHEEAGDTIAEAREIMQDRIEEWQQEASSTAAAAKNALDGARVRTEYGTGSAAARELYGRAWLNWNTYTNDGSSGVHNPPYLVAGLKAAQRMADSVGGRIENASVSTRLTVGTVGAVAAHIDMGTGESAEQAQVSLERYVGGTWVEEGTTEAGTNGNVAFMVSPPIGTYTYRLRWHRCSNQVADLFSSNLRMTVVKVTSTTTAAASATSIPLGNAFTLRGAVTPRAAGQLVTIYYRKGTSGTWSTVTAPLNASSAYARAFRPTSRGYWYYRVRYPGTTTVAVSWSPYVRVRVF